MKREKLIALERGALVFTSIVFLTPLILLVAALIIYFVFIA